jgi:hypothetical protein
MYPPAALTPEQHAQYGQLAQDHIEHAVKHDFKASEDAFRQMNEIGQFVPCFMHHPDSGLLPIYPTVPTDMAHLIRLGRILTDHIK